MDPICDSTGFVGADLANITNEAALLTARNEKESVEPTDFDEAIDRVVAGLQKKNQVMNHKGKEIVAFHESGHAIVAEYGMSERLGLVSYERPRHRRPHPERRGLRPIIQSDNIAEKGDIEKR